eukprot:TRINITY_DN13282_c0_g2_i4.p1 TRINITY_DN13282_c0_g2~~TRINITY_DN13282_c0_g2_i4.p1  ORF type:complete len:143 (-),score=18.79 TRINITY_DN13282_c0_g2_i4:699-1127(-)
MLSSRFSIKMKISSYLSLFLSLLLLHGLFHSKLVIAVGTADGTEEWGYVEVRPRAHMFWWLYRSPQRSESSSSPWPIILWLQGGPGASGIAIGNFQEIGPLDTNLKPRKSTWLQKADLLFVVHFCLPVNSNSPHTCVRSSFS